MPTRSRRSSGGEQPPRAAESVPEAAPADDAEQRDTGSFRPQLSHGEQERLRRKLREKFH
jgi:hypothetical protein